MKRAILLVGGGLLQQRAVEIARNDLGLHVIVTDKNPNCHCAGLADEFYAVDTRDWQSHIDLAQRLAKRKEPRLAAIFTQGASVERTVALAAWVVGLLGIHPDTARQISHKGLMRDRLWEAGISQPAYSWNRTYEEASANIDIFPFPAIVKPVDSSGSRGVTIVCSRKDFTKEVFDRALAESREGAAIVEQLLTPVSDEIAEQSVETVWQDGKGYWLNWVDRPFLQDSHPGVVTNYAVELGHYNPAIHGAETQRQVENMVMEAGHALGMTTGIFKCDIILTKDGPRILETTARLSGGFDAQYTSPLAHGVNYIRGAMRMALGEPIPWEDFLPKWHRHAVALSAFPKPGKVSAISGIESAMKIKDIECVFPRVKIGDVIQPYSDCAGRPLFVIASGDTRQEAVGAAQNALDVIRIETGDAKK